MAKVANTMLHITDTIRAELALLRHRAGLPGSLRCGMGHLPTRSAHCVGLITGTSDSCRQYRYAGKALPSRLANLPPKSVPGISIIRPLCGLDNNLYNTLESVMKLEYPKYEVIFALQDEHDEAIPVVKMILDKFPTIPARIIISTSPR